MKKELLDVEELYEKRREEKETNDSNLKEMNQLLEEQSEKIKNLRITVSKQDDYLGNLQTEFKKLVLYSERIESDLKFSKQ